MLVYWFFNATLLWVLNFVKIRFCENAYLVKIKVLIRMKWCTEHFIGGTPTQTITWAKSCTTASQGTILLKHDILRKKYPYNCFAMTMHQLLRMALSLCLHFSVYLKTGA